MYQNEDISLYLKDVRSSAAKLLTKSQEVNLAKRIQNGDKKAEEQLILSNLRFVISIAKQYQNIGIPLPDLINEGNYGLVKAAKRYKLEMGFRFISYAVWWIKQSILQCINDNSRMIRLPVNLSNELLKLRNLTAEDMENQPTPKAMMCPSVILYDSGVQHSDSEPNRTTQYDTLSDSKDNRPDYKMMEKESSLKVMLETAMESLEPREYYIIYEYFLADGDTKTLEVIGNELNLTKERVRQIRDKALRKIRNNSEPLFAFVGGNQI